MKKLSLLVAVLAVSGAIGAGHYAEAAGVTAVTKGKMCSRSSSGSSSSSSSGSASANRYSSGASASASASRYSGSSKTFGSKRSRKHSR